MAKVKWLRNGERFEKNVLIIVGYYLNENIEFIENDSASTMINPIDFDHFCNIESTIEKIGGEFPVKFQIGDVVYFSDFCVINSIISLASDIFHDAVEFSNINDNPHDFEDCTEI